MGVGQTGRREGWSRSPGHVPLGWPGRADALRGGRPAAGPAGPEPGPAPANRPNYLTKTYKGGAGVRLAEPVQG